MNVLLMTDVPTAAKKMSAMDSLVVLEKEFATLRDRYDNRAVIIDDFCANDIQ